MKKFDATGLPHASFEALYPTVFRAGSPDVDLGSPFLKCVTSIWAFSVGGEGGCKGLPGWFGALFSHIAWECKGFSG